MRRVNSTMVIAAILIFVLCSTTAAAQESSTEATSDYSLQRIANSLDKIVRLLTEQNDVQKSSLLMERLRLDSEELLSSERSLERHIEQRDSIDSQVRMLNSQIAAEEERLYQDSSVLDPERERELDALQAEYELMLNRLSEERTAIETKVIEAENKVRDLELQRDATRRQIDRALGIDRR